MDMDSIEERPPFLFVFLVVGGKEKTAGEKGEKDGVDDEQRE